MSTYLYAALLVVLAIVTLAGCLVLPYLMVYIIYYAAKNKVFATFVQNGTIELVGSGSDENGNVADYVQTLHNVTEFVLVRKCKMCLQYWVEEASPVRPDPKNPDSIKYNMVSEQRTVELNDAIIPEDYMTRIYPDGARLFDEVLEYPSDNKSGWERFILWCFRRLGFTKEGEVTHFKWVSLFYFFRKIGSFRILRARVKDQAIIKNSHLRDTIETRPDIVDNLIWRSERPILVKDVDLLDRSRADLRVNVIVVFVVPRTAVFNWKHRFYPVLDSAIEAAAFDYARKRSYAQLVSHEQTGPYSEFFQRALSRLNAVGGGQTQEGLVKGMGVMVVNGWIEDIEISEKDQKILEADQAKEIAARQGDADVIKAEKKAEAARKEARGLRDAHKIEGIGEAKRAKWIMIALGGNVDAFNQYMKISQREATPELTTLIEGDAKTNAVISLPAGTKLPDERKTDKSKNKST